MLLPKENRVAATQANVSRLREQLRVKLSESPETKELCKPHEWLSDILPDGSWQGQRCFIIGGGPSLKGFDFSRLKGELVIGINRAYEVIDPDLLVAMDASFIANANTGAYGHTAKARWNAMRGTKVFVAQNNPQHGVYNVPRTLAYNASLKSGVYAGDNSGMAAINIAIALGCSEIYLLGFDMHGDAQTGKQTWWHSGHPKDQGDKVYSRFLNTFNRHAEAIKSRARVINCNPKSALQCFEFGELPEPKPCEYQVVSFYTKDTGYETEIKNLEKSLVDLKIPYHFFAFPARGTWRENLNYKSECILQAFDIFPDKDIVFLDCDAVVKRKPILFSELSNTKTHDLSAHYFQYSERSGGAMELLSGTLWIANSQAARTLVQRWHDIGLRRPEVKHQQCLKLAIAELEKEGMKIRINRHPFAYTCIFDYPLAKKCVPVIEHFQASRRFRKAVGYGKPLGTGE